MNHYFSLEPRLPQQTSEKIPSHHVGFDIRALRQRRGKTLQSLATAVGRSVGWLSQVERGVSEPAIRDLRLIASVFDLQLGFFFRNETAPSRERGLVVRAAARSFLGNAEDEGLFEQMLSPDLGGDFEMVHCFFNPYAKCENRQRQTEESGYLIDGQLWLWIDEEKYELEAGDSFRFKDKAFRWENPSDQPCEVVWVISPPVY